MIWGIRRITGESDHIYAQSKEECNGKIFSYGAMRSVRETVTHCLFLSVRFNASLGITVRKRKESVEFYREI